MKAEEWRACFQYIEEHLKEEELSLERIASAAGYSRWHFGRMFREQTGMTVMKYVLRRRLLCAAEEIRAGKRILDAALDYGFPSHSCFSNTYRREMGYHPSLLKLKKEFKGGIAMERSDREELKGRLLAMYENPGDRELIESLCRLSGEIYRGKKRYSGEEYATHPLHVALLLAEAEAELWTVLAGLFCDWDKKGEGLRERMEELPPQVRSILSELPETPVKELSDEALLVKTAERLHNMQTIEYMDAGVWKKKAEETLRLLAAVNDRIQKSHMAEELRGLAVTYLDRGEKLPK